jgi:hypothetical protein
MVGVGTDHSILPLQVFFTRNLLIKNISICNLSEKNYDKGND